MATQFSLKCAKESAGTIALPNICISTWSWGDSTTWNNASSSARELLDGAWTSMQKHGLSFVDTAEVYGNGESERIIGSLQASNPDDYKARLIVASKFLPIPVPPTKLFMPNGMIRSCRQSLERLGLSQMGLYMIHGPVHIFNSIDSIAGGLAKCVELELTRAVGGMDNG